MQQKQGERSILDLLPLLLQGMKDNVEAMMEPIMVSICSSEECLKLSMLYIPHHTMLNLYILKEMSAKLTTHSMSGHVEGEGGEYHNGFTPIASEQFTHIIMHTSLYSAGSWFIHKEKRKYFAAKPSLPVGQELS